MPITEEIEKLDLSPDDVVVVTLGGDIDGEQWIPTMEDVQKTLDTWADAMPDGVEVIVTHQLHSVKIIRPVSCTTWPPKVKHDR